MANYKANAYLLHQGKVVNIGDDIELNDDQAKRLLDKGKIVKPGETVTATNGAEQNTSKALVDLTLTELKEEAKAANVEGFSKMNKDELIAAIEKARTESKSE